VDEPHGGRIALERYDLVIPSHAERLIEIAAHDHHEICEVGERREAIEKGDRLKNPNGGVQ
jgi:hypothetical protein